MLSIPELIDKKRRGERLDRSELERVVLGYTRGEVPDYQVAAWLMAVCWRGMEAQEVAELTEIMADSGQRLDLSRLGRTVADKHSTGGVGDKTSLVVIPLVAACGVPIAKMSGRGLGFSGGTLDKLESIPGLKVDLDVDRFLRQVSEVGLAIVGQSPELAPADGKLYALRDVTATVESIPLIASSIMSKKLAAGAQAIVLDVKVGSGAFMPTLEQARLLAETMVRIGTMAGRRMAAVVSDMSQPLGRTVGNALEVAEAIETLQGKGSADLLHLAVVLAGRMLVAAGAAPDTASGERLIRQALGAGHGLEALARLIRAQGGDERVVDDPGRLPVAGLRHEVQAATIGLVARIDARSVALASLALGAGRDRKDAPIDRSVGIRLHVRVGDRIEARQPLASIYANDQARLERAKGLVEQAFHVAEEAVAIAPLIYWKSDLTL